MSSREKKLLIFFGVAGFIVLNFLLVNWGLAYRGELENQRLAAKADLEFAQMAVESSEAVADEQEWLAEHEPEPQPYQTVQTDLQGFVDREARLAGLEVRSQSLQPTNTSGAYYHRAKVEFSVTGAEPALYRWFDRLNMPTAFRRATQIVLSPNKNDDTQIDCKVVVEQWFVPPPADENLAP